MGFNDRKAEDCQLPRKCRSCVGETSRDEVSVQVSWREIGTFPSGSLDQLEIRRVETPSLEFQRKVPKKADSSSVSR